MWNFNSRGDIAELRKIIGDMLKVEKLEHMEILIHEAERCIASIKELFSEVEYENE